MADSPAADAADPTPARDCRPPAESEVQPVLSGDPIAADDEASRTVLLAELNEAAAAWRMLTDVRFKLLALLPPISALALTAIVSPKGVLEEADRPVRVAAAVFGFLVVLGLRIYEHRNDDLYGDLMKRAEQAEFELGIETGVFGGRKKPDPLWKARFKVCGWRTKPAKWAGLIKKEGDHVSLVTHRFALKLVYGTVLAAWFLAGVSAAVGWVP